MHKAYLTPIMIGVMSIGTAAHAADLTEQYLPTAVISAPVNSWAGFYFGGNLGYGWNGNNSTLTSFLDSDGSEILSSKGFASKGAFGGAQAGYNWQRGRIVYGLEADLQASDIQDKFIAVPVTFVDRQAQQSVDWFGTIRGRLGYSFGSTLVFLTGGFAYGSVDSNVTTSLFVAAPVGRLARNAVETGYVLGGGVEYRLTPSWSIKGEYQYLDFGSQPLTGTLFDVATIHTNEVNNNFNTVRFGINYHLNSGPSYEPLK